jgi:hypothetical protein
MSIILKLIIWKISYFGRLNISEEEDLKSSFSAATTTRNVQVSISPTSYRNFCVTMKLGYNELGY